MTGAELGDWVEAVFVMWIFSLVFGTIRNMLNR